MPNLAIVLITNYHLNCFVLQLVDVWDWDHERQLVAGCIGKYDQTIIHKHVCFSSFDCFLDFVLLPEVSNCFDAGALTETDDILSLPVID